MVGLKSSISTIQECLLYSARSFAGSKQDEVALLRIDKARSVLDLRARVVLALISKRAYALHSLSTKGALERASEAFHLVASPFIPHPTLSFSLKLPTFGGLIDWIPPRTIV